MIDTERVLQLLERTTAQNERFSLLLAQIADGQKEQSVRCNKNCERIANGCTENCNRITVEIKEKAETNAKLDGIKSILIKIASTVGVGASSGWAVYNYLVSKYHGG